MRPHPPAFELDRLVAGELGGEPATSLSKHLKECPACQAYVDRRRSEQEELLARLPPQVLANKLEARGREPGRATHLPVWLSLGALAAAAVLALVIFWLPGQPDETGVRWMGESLALRIYRDRGGQTSLYDGRPQPGDRLRYEITLPEGKTGHAAVVAVVDRKAIPLLPADPDATAFELTGTGLIPGSVVIEAGPEKVRLLLFVRPRSFWVSHLLAEIQNRLQDPGEKIELGGLVDQQVLEVNSR